MSERFYANIAIPRSFLEREDVRKAVSEQFAWSANGSLEGCETQEFQSSNKVAVFEDENARCGYFESLEDKLVKLKVPFDRYSSAYYECGAIYYFYRPDGKTKHFFAYGENDRTMPCKEIRMILKENAFPGNAVQKIQELLDMTYDPYIKPLEEY